MKKDLTILIAFMLILTAFFAYQEQPTGKAVQDCYDSDGGLEFTSKGTVATNSETLTDSCQENQIIEYYCLSNRPQIKIVSCPETCNDGACKSAESSSSPAEESLQLSTKTNQLEIGESLGDVIGALTQVDISTLGSSRVNTGKSTTIANQYLRFGDSDFSSGSILFAENNENEIADFLVFPQENVTFEYELEFAQGLKSSRENNDLVDLSGAEVTILGRSYKITAAERSNNRITLKLISGAVEAALSEGEEQTYTFNGKEYAIKIMSIDDQARKVMFSVNNLVSGQRSVNEAENIADIAIGVTKIIISEAGEQKDQVTLVLGAETLELTDNDITDENFTQGASVSGKSISSAYVKIKGTGDSAEQTISSIKYRVKAEEMHGEDIFIPSGKGMRAFMRYPETLLGDWDILYKGLDAKQSTIKLDPRSNGYDLEFINKKGQRYDPTIITNNNGNLKIGKENTALHFIEGASAADFIIAQQDAFILTSENNRNGITNILKYDSIDTASKKIFFDDLAEGKKEASYSGTEGTDATASVTIQGNTYQAHIGAAPEYKLAIDLNHDGDIASDEVNIVVQGGGLLDLGSTLLPNTDFTLTLTTKEEQFDTRNGDETITINITNSGGSLDLDLPEQTALDIEAETGKKLAMSPYGVFLKQRLSNPDELLIQYPDHQAIGKVDLSFYKQVQPIKPIKPIMSPEKETPPSQQPVQEVAPQQELPAPEPIITYEEKNIGVRAWLQSVWRKIKSWF